MKKEAFLKTVSTLARTFSNIELAVKPFGMGLYPLQDYVSRTNQIASVLYTEVEDSTDGSVHLVVIGFTQDTVEVWCGDPFLEGKLDSAEQMARMRDAQIGCAPAVQDKALIQMQGLQGIARTTNPTCTFWKEYIRTRGNYMCEHVQAALLSLELQPELIEQAQDLYEWAVGSTNSLMPKLAILGQDLPFDLKRLAFKVPVLTEGDRGSGKTREVRMFAREQGYPLIELAGNESVEAQDMLGYLIPDGKHNLVWKDGPLAAGFRRARKEKVVLLIDEILRIPQRQLSILLTALSSDEGVYRLTTGRVLSVEDGVATEEVLECKCENLAVCATTNVGAEYAVDTIDPALSERFFIIRKDTTGDSLEQMLAEITSHKGFSHKVTKFLMRFWKKASELQAQGQLNFAPTNRTIARIVELSETESETARVTKEMGLQWVARGIDGKPVNEQLKTLAEVVETLEKEELNAVVA